MAARATRSAWTDRVLVLYARANGLDVTRFGFSVGRRVGGAVRRNEIKRRLRAVASQTPVDNGWDVVVIARKGATDADFRVLKASLDALLLRAGLRTSFIGAPVSDMGT